MGQGYSIKCADCGYGLTVQEGVGMMYSPDAVFYGRCDDPSQNWSIAFPDGYCENDKPLLLELVKSKKIKEKAFKLLANGATPGKYGHELYFCPKCMRFSNRFYFKLKSPDETYEPDYRCSHCRATLLRVRIKFGKDGSAVIVGNRRKIKWRCPECKGENLDYGDEIIYWD